MNMRRIPSSQPKKMKMFGLFVILFLLPLINFQSASYHVNFITLRYSQILEFSHHPTRKVATCIKTPKNHQIFKFLQPVQ